MIKRYIFFLLFLFSGYLISAQQKMLTMEDAILKAGSSLAPQTLHGLKWIADTDQFSYFTQDDPDVLIKHSASSNKKERVIELDELNTKVQEISGSPLNYFPGVHWLHANAFVFTANNEYYSIELPGKKLTLLSKIDGENADINYKSLSVAYTRENNLYINQNGQDKEIAVTNEPNKDIVNGQSAHRNEFGIEKGTFWSPTGKLLAYYRMDQTMVTDYPILDVSKRPAEENLIKYPMAGMTSHEVTIGIFNPDNGKTVFLETGKPADQYLTNISWSPDEKLIYVAVVNRDQNHLWLNQYDVVTGKFIKTLFEESHPKYVEPLDPLIFIPGKNDEFLWISQRDGFKHFYHYNTDGKLIRQVTKGNWVVTSFLGFDKAGKTLFYSSTAEAPAREDGYSVEIASGKVKRLTSTMGKHRVQIGNGGRYMLDNYHSISTPTEIWLKDLSKNKSTLLLKSGNPLRDYKLGHSRLFTIKADDGKTDLYCRIILPIDFDSTKKYPVVVYVYGGPHLQLVNEGWLGGANLWMHYMAQRGYIMFTLDNRGTLNRGMEFEQATFQNLGTIEMNDQLQGVKFLKSLPFVDSARIGVHGWSFGGFMTTSLMTRSPGVFKVGVGGGPVIDWRYYEVMYTERYMDTPEQNPEGYKKSDLLNYVRNLKGKLLLIHGTVDDVVVWQHSLIYLKKAVDEGKLLDYFVYPGHPHNVRGKDRVHLYNKVTQYFEENL